MRGGGGGGGDKGDKGFDFSLWLTKSDHVITLLCLCGFERKQPEEKFSPASYFLGQDFSWVTCNSFGRSYLPSTPFRAFLFGASNRKQSHEIGFPETAEPQKVLSRDQNVFNWRLRQRLHERGFICNRVVSMPVTSSVAETVSI